MARTQENEAAARLWNHKMVFRSDFPSLAPDRWLNEWEEIPIREEVRSKVLWENAQRALGLGR